MSRSGYVEDWDFDGTNNVWRGAVASAMRGKRGQAFLREMRDAMDAMPNKRLIEERLVTDSGEVCAMGTVCARRGLDVSDIDPEDYERVADRIGLSRAMVQEIAYHNDEGGFYNYRERRGETPEERWVRMRAWVEKQIVNPTPAIPEHSETREVGR